MVGADEEMRVTMVRWKLGEAQLKKDLDEEELKKVVEEKEKKDTQGACAAELKREPEKKPKGEPEGKPGVKKPDFTFLMIERVIDTILLEEVAHLSMNITDTESSWPRGLGHLLKTTRRIKQTCPICGSFQTRLESLQGE